MASRGRVTGIVTDGNRGASILVVAITTLLGVAAGLAAAALGAYVNCLGDSLGDRDASAWWWLAYPLVLGAAGALGGITVVAIAWALRSRADRLTR